MSLNRRWSKDAKLYLILDAQVNSYDELWRILTQSVSSGVGIVQLRDKLGSARDILKFAAQAKRYLKNEVPFIINDHVDLAMLAQASGVHLGQEDIPIAAARRMIGKTRLIGISCQTLAHAVKAQKEGADYIGLGSIFKTQTKPEREPMDIELLKSVVSKIKIPVFAIGGIKAENISALRLLGVVRVAVCREICLAQDVKKATKKFKDTLD